MIYKGAISAQIRSFAPLIVVLLSSWVAATAWASGSKPEATYVLSGLFDTRQATLSNEGQRQLDDIVEQWQGESGLMVEVSGHTDNIPIAPRNRREFADNYALSEARATSVANYLRGMLGERVTAMSVQGRGPDQAIADNSTAAGRKRNRRVEVSIRIPAADVATQSEAPTAAPPESQEPQAAILNFDQVVSQANQLLTGGNSEAALALLEDYPDFIGQPDYDYLLGLALRANGRQEEAMFALERVVAVDPKFAGARLELAQIYMALGAKDEARRELEYLQGQNPPPAAQMAIADALAALDESIQAKPPRKAFRYYLRSAAGFDGNANSATDLNSFLGFTLSEASRETSSGFSEIGGGFQYLKPSNNARQLIAFGDFGHRFNFDASFVNATTGRVGAALRWRGERQTRSVSVQGYRQNVSGDLNSQGVALLGNWNFNLTPQVTLGGFGRLGVVRFDETQEVRDVDQYVFGVSANYKFAAASKANLGAVALYGVDQAAQTDSRYDRDFYGLRLSGGWQFTPKVRGEVYGSRLQSDFDEVFFPEQFSSPREDTLTQFGTRVSWRLNEHWILDHLWRYQENDTDVLVFDYDRVETLLTATRIW